MPTLDESFPALEAALSEHYGRPGAPIAGEPFLAVAAAVLAGDASAAKVAGARVAMSGADLLDPRVLADADAVAVAELFRETPLRMPRKAIATLQRLARWLCERDDADEESLAGFATDTLRDELRGLNGIGRATADALLLHGLGRAAYPLDRATYRVFARHGWIDPAADYDEARAVVERPVADDRGRVARLAWSLEQVGRDFCRAGAPRCERCPLAAWLPEGGPVDPSA